MRPDFIISDHALARFAERQPGVAALKLQRRRRLLVSQLRRGVVFGEQLGNEELYLLPCGAVAAIVRVRSLRIVKTILTYDQALASVQALWHRGPRWLVAS